MFNNTRGGNHFIGARYHTVDVKVNNAHLKVEDPFIIKGSVEISDCVSTPLLIVESISTPEDTALTLDNVTMNNVKISGLEISGPLLLDNGLSFRNSKCNHCAETTGIAEFSGHSLCFNCINEAVIFHQAKQSWIEQNGDPMVSCLQKIDTLSKELDLLKQEMQEMRKQTLR